MPANAVHPSRTFCFLQECEPSVARGRNMYALLDRASLYHRVFPPLSLPARATSRHVKRLATRSLDRKLGPPIYHCHQYRGMFSVAPEQKGPISELRPQLKRPFPSASDNSCNGTRRQMWGLHWQSTELDRTDSGQILRALVSSRKAMTLRGHVSEPRASSTCRAFHC